MEKTLLITGASTGIGEACALRLDRAGHRVYAGIRTEKDAERLRAQASPRLTPVFLDVTDEAQIDATTKQIAGEAQGLDGLVNNAGIARGGPIEYLPLDEWREQFEVNVFGQLAVTQAVLPLIRSAAGRVVFIGSIGGKAATSLMAPYSASKFAIEAIGETLRAELRPWGLHVSVVEPGAIKTAIWEKGRETADRLERDLPAEGAARYGAHIAAVRKGIDMQDRQGVSADEVAKAVEHALFARVPKTRYLVGVDARVTSALVRFLPDRSREAFLRRFAGP